MTSVLAAPAFVRDAKAAPNGFDVILLVGQSNMAGYNIGSPDNPTDGVGTPFIWQLDIYNKIVPAMEPIIQASQSSGVSMAMTFAKAYAATLPAGRGVLLVGAAYVSTGFQDGSWLPPSGPRTKGALDRANIAMAAAGPGSRFAGILWHQGESDILGGAGAAYAANLTNLIAFFRSSITGASGTTPFVCGEVNYNWIVDNLISDPAATKQQDLFLQAVHSLPDKVPYTAWVSSVGLGSDPATGHIHFDALGERQLGRRYADKLFEAANNLPQPDVSLKSWNGSFVDDGRSFPAGSSAPVNRGCAVSGIVTPVTDPVRGNVAQISGGRGSIAISVLGTLFRRSYTKMAWFKPGQPQFYNNLVAASNPGQAHWLAAVTSPGQVTIAAGHSDGTGVPAPAASVTVPVNAGAWIHVAVVYDSAALTMTLYCNGVPITVARGVAPAPSINGVVPLVMGAFGSLGAGVDGQMSGNRAWAVALTPAQIAAIYGYENTARAGF